MSSVPYIVESAAWSEADPEANRDAFQPGVFVFVVLQMGLLMSVGLSGSRSPVVLAGAVTPLLVVSLFQPFVGLCMMFAVVLYEDLFILVGGVLTLTKLLAFFTGIGFLFRCQRQEHSVVPPEAITRLGIAFALLCMISAFWAPNPLISFKNAMTPALLSICLLMASQLINTRARLRTVLMCVTLACVVGGSMMLIYPDVGTGYVASGRASIGETNVNKMASLLVLGLLAATHLALTTRSWLVRLGLIAAIVVILVAILATKSRTGFGALILGFAAGGVLGLRGGISQRLALFAFVVLVSAGGYLLISSTNIMGEGTFSRWKHFDRGTDTRTYIWRVAYQVWLANPAVGVGYGGFSAGYTDVAHEQNRYQTGLGRDPHNTLLKVVCELGPLGLFVFLSIFTALGIYCFKVRPGPDANLVFALVTAMSIMSLASSMMTVKFFWYTMAIVVAMAITIPKNEGLEAGSSALPSTEFPPAFASGYA